MTVSYFVQPPSRAALWKRGALLAFTLGAGLTLSSEAAAQQACGESTCAKGFTCQTSGGACPAIDCPEGADCPVCEPKEYHMCVPAACASDAECGTDQVCAEQIVYDCPPSQGKAEPACPPGAECAPAQDIAAPTCTTSTVSYCTLRWQLPCSVAADCGAGFDCVPQESCSTSGSTGGGSAGAPTPGVDPVPPSDGAPQREAPAPAPTDPPVTTCEPTGYSACVPIQVACDSDADCLSGWTCETNPNGVCWSGPDGRGCAPADPAKLCVPPYYGTRGAIPGVAGPVEDGSNAGPGTPTASPIPESPQAPGSSPPPFGAEGEAADDVVQGSNGGCAVSASPSAANGLAWLALGLAGLFGLRRRR